MDSDCEGAAALADDSGHFSCTSDEGDIDMTICLFVQNLVDFGKLGSWELVGRF